MKNSRIIIGALLSTASLTATAQSPYIHDRVYTSNQVSNTVSVVDPSSQKLSGEIVLGKPYPNVLSPIYRGESLVHGLRYLPQRKMLAAVSIGSNAVTLMSTETNKVIKTIYVGRSPHEPTFSPDGKQLWISVRGEAYVSVIDMQKMTEVKRVPVADGPGMVSFSPDGKTAYVCSSFTAEVDVINTADYTIRKKIKVVSPFSPNIFTSPQGDYVAMTHKDVGKVTIIKTADLSIAKVIPTGAITNHVTFTNLNKKLLMLVTVGGENKVRVFDVQNDFKQTDSISVGALPHGIWPSNDGKYAYVGLEYGDQVQAIDLETMTAKMPIKIGQSPQALVYAANAVSNVNAALNLSPLGDVATTNIVVLKDPAGNTSGIGRLAFRPIGLTDLIEQIFTGLTPDREYDLVFTRSKNAPYKSDDTINTFHTDAQGKFSGQSTGIVKSNSNMVAGSDYEHIVLIDKVTNRPVLLNLPGAEEKVK